MVLRSSRSRTSVGRALFVACALWLLVSPPLRAQGAEPASNYRIGPKDLLAVEVFEIPELNTETRVSETGEMDLPLVGKIAVQGLDEQEAAQRLKDLLERKYVQRASVRVQVKEFRSRPISVIGAVNKPGALSLPGRFTLLEALTAAGGLADKHGNVVYVIRNARNGLSDQLKIRIDDLMVRADPRANVPVFGSDLINVPAPVPMTVFCLGEVNRPGALEFMSTERVTILAAVARAGGLTPRASSTILVKRRDEAGRERQIEASYKDILSQKQPDLPLLPNDIVVVKTSFF